MISVSSVFDTLLSVRAQQGAGLIVLVDPDKLPEHRMDKFLASCAEAGVDAIFMGGSLVHVADLGRYVRRLKQASPLHVIGFPGSITQIVSELDAVLFLSVISSRNAELLFGQHVAAAPIIRSMGLETIPTGYMLVESGRMTSAQYMSHSLPLPRHNTDIGVATALAAEMLGMRMLYADAGSGAEWPIPSEWIHAVSDAVRLPLVVGGGLQKPSDVERAVLAGASFVVVGTALESRADRGFMSELAAAAHGSVTRSA
jgi:phosphoglycerol geranylgeranyltransferase